MEPSARRIFGGSEDYRLAVTEEPQADVLLDAAASAQGHIRGTRERLAARINKI